jgi:hypothetical protein
MPGLETLAIQIAIEAVMFQGHGGVDSLLTGVD